MNNFNTQKYSIENKLNQFGIGINIKCVQVIQLFKNQIGKNKILYFKMSNKIRIFNQF